MNPEIAALVDVQSDDLAIHELERGIDQLMPKVNAVGAEVVKAVRVKNALSEMLDQMQ